MSSGFYRALEDRLRGSRDLIKSRLQVYLPFIEIEKSIYSRLSALDLGCGRGEWLELLQEMGIAAHGVDLDDGMLAACRQIGLSVETGEAISYLKNQPDECHHIISGFHIAEHIPFNELQTMVSEALRVLKPAGLLILETPNPENVRVGTSNFYLDPTHKRPIPSDLLSFIPDYYGFFRTKVICLQESKELAASANPTLLDVLSGVSPDYAVIAQKSAEPQVLARFDALLVKEYGLSLNELAMRYETNIQQNFSTALQLATGRVEQAEQKAQQAEQKAQQAEQKAQQAEADLRALFSSRSWRVTAPMRTLFQRARLLREKALLVKPAIKRAIKEPAKLFLHNLIAFVLRHPSLKIAAKSQIRNFPKFESKLRRFRYGSKFLTDIRRQNKAPVEIEHLPPRGRKIYSQLKAAIEHRKKETH